MSNYFSFSGSVFKRLVLQTLKNKSLFRKELMVWQDQCDSMNLIKGNKKGIILWLFSSPKHKVLRVSYFDWSIVRLSIRLSVCSQLQKKSSPKLTIRFQSDFTEIILRSCSFKRLQRIEFSKELWLPWQQSERTLKIFLSQTVRARAFIFGM